MWHACILLLSQNLGRGITLFSNWKIELLSFSIWQWNLSMQQDLIWCRSAIETKCTIHFLHIEWSRWGNFCMLVIYQLESILLNLPLFTYHFLEKHIIWEYRFKYWIHVLVYNNRWKYQCIQCQMIEFTTAKSIAVD